MLPLKTTEELRAAKQAKAQLYAAIVTELCTEHRIEVCYRCTCRGAGYAMGHSRAHAHPKARKICLSSSPKGYKSFFTVLHEIGHVVAEKASYSSGVPRALAEHNATEWAYAELRRRGIPIKRSVKEEYSDYITNKIERGLRRGLQVVPKELRKYR